MLYIQIGSQGIFSTCGVSFAIYCNYMFQHICVGLTLFGESFFCLAHVFLGTYCLEGL